MKRIFSLGYALMIITFLAATMSISSCGTANGMAAKRAKDPNLVQPADDQAITETWTTLFSRVVGVEVRGAEPNLSIRIRGDKSIELSNEPLYVLDGVRLGQEFSRLASAILPQDVKSIRIVKGSSATMYGDSSGNGVVVVASKE